MADLERFRAILKEIAQEWDKAERDIKLAEQVCAEVIIPSVNELRYAGRRVVDALIEACGGGDEDKIAAYLADARFDCHRARHDAIDAALSKIATDLDLMVRRLGYEAVLRAYPGFSAFFLSFSETRKLIVESRGDRTKREQIYSAIEEKDFPRLVATYREVSFCEPMMKSVARKERAQRWLSYAIAILGVVLGAIGLFV